MIILILGNPVDGFTFIGSFQDAQDAIDYAEDNHIMPDWWISELENPKIFEEGLIK